MGGETLKYHGYEHKRINCKVWRRRRSGCTVGCWTPGRSGGRRPVGRSRTRCPSWRSSTVATAPWPAASPTTPSPTGSPTFQIRRAVVPKPVALPVLLGPWCDLMLWTPCHPPLPRPLQQPTAEWVTCLAGHANRPSHERSTISACSLLVCGTRFVLCSAITSQQLGVHAAPPS